MIRRTTLPFALCLLAASVSAQDEKPASKPASQPAQKQDARAQVLKLLKTQGVHLDIDKRLVRAEGKINVTSDFLEFVAIGPRGKKHESLVMLKCLGSTLNTALALLKLPKGKNVDYQKVEPMPTREEVENGAPTVKVIPPEGPKVFLAVQWKGKDGKPVLHAVEDLILDIRADKTLQKVEWIYFGGRMAALYRGEPPVFIADYEQNYISCYYVKPDNQLITIRHARGNYDDNWWPNEHLLPDRGTPCELLISLKPIVKRLPLEKAYPDAGKRPERQGEGPHNGPQGEAGEHGKGEHGKGEHGKEAPEAGK